MKSYNVKNPAHPKTCSRCHGRRTETQVTYTTGFFYGMITLIPLVETKKCGWCQGTGKQK